MKLSELRPCDRCGGPIGQNFYVLRVSSAFVAPMAVNQVLGMTQVLGGNLALAEVMAPDADVVVVAGDKEPALMSEFLICQACALHGPLDVALLLEKQNGG